MMNELSLVAAFMIGLLGSTHCIGMCGGIVGSLTMGLGPAQRRSFFSLLPYLLVYNFGRLSSYALAGFLLGWLTQSLGGFFSMGGFPLGGFIGGLFMLALGVYIAGWWQSLAVLEKAGAVFWRKIEPLGRRFLPVSSLPQALGLGLLWGWLPCGMVYSTLAWASTSGSAVQTSALMLAFGLGTLPMLLLMGTLAQKLQAFSRNPWVRNIAGLILIGFGVLMLVNVFGGGHQHGGHMQHMMPGHEMNHEGMDHGAMGHEDMDHSGH
ncbi:MAG TPA: sulfite exporter TauE/SafE family protein [Gammaproteobacteria bacterium]|nr:sulfite exporter TauE/SafE family protein [Gammaproteobacteria bacterium]